MLAAPDFVWQAAHGWPNLAVFHALQGDAWQNRAQYWPLQVLYTSILLVPLWVRGIRWALRHPLLRVVGIAAVFVIVAQFVLGGKAYYPGGIYTFCFAAGAVSLEGLPWRRRRGHLRRAGVISSLISLPVLPAAALARVPVQKINYDLGEEIGWPSEVEALAAAWRALPPAERARATLLAGNYGEAGAVDRYGASFGLPQVYSGANSFWFWGPPPAADTVVVAISVDPALLHREFAHVTQVAVYHNGLNVADDEQGAVIYVATGLRTSWTAAWPAFKLLLGEAPGIAAAVSAAASAVPLRDAVAAGGRVVAGEAGQLGQQPRRGKHLEERLDLAGGGVLGGDDQAEALLGERDEGQAVGAGGGLARHAGVREAGRHRGGDLEVPGGLGVVPGQVPGREAEPLPLGVEQAARLGTGLAVDDPQPVLGDRAEPGDRWTAARGAARAPRARR